MKPLVLVALGLAALSSCGGKAVIDGPPGSGGASATSGTTSQATNGTGTTSTSTGSAPDCRVQGCAMGQVCHQPTGACLRSCDPADGSGCQEGLETCNACATSSCRGCEDCRAACVPANGATICADQKDCPETDVCVYATNTCAKRCGTGDPADVCPSGVCQQCITSSCFGCDDCVSACTLAPAGR